LLDLVEEPFDEIARTIQIRAEADRVFAVSLRRNVCPCPFLSGKLPDPIRVASDITLVIDAMDLLHSGRFDGFCLVSSDSDFTRLAARIREQGVDVFGFGEQKTPESFRQACRRFIYTENLLPGAANSQDATSTSKPLQPPSEATPIIKKVITQMESEDGWVPLGEVGKQLANLASDFDPRTFGFRKLSDLVRKTNSFEIEHPRGGTMRIRTKAPAGTTPKPKAINKAAT
jgi:uncharacterized LabA/DUF88 family protein